MAKSILTKLSEKYKQYSGFDFLKRTCKWLFRKMGINIETYNYFINNLETTDLEIILPAGFEIIRLQMNDISCSQLIKFSDEQKLLFQSRINDEFYESYGIIREGRLVYYFNISLKDMECPLPKGTLALNDDEGLLVDGYCHPDFRGVGLHTAMSIHLLKRLKQLGKKRAVTFIIEENKGARKSQEKIGFKFEKQFTLTKLKNKTYTKITDK